MSCCDQVITGKRTCHCAGCCRNFSGLTAFDRHQRWEDGQLKCLDPETFLDSAGKPVFSPGSRYARWKLNIEFTPFWEKGQDE